MTLLVALANKDIAILVADRRISCDGKILNEEYNKLCVLFCNDAKLSIAFTGIATVGSFSTADWLEETLYDISTNFQEIAGILVELQSRLQAKIQTIQVADKRLTILFSGFVYWSAVPEPRIYVLSNFEQTGVIQDIFALRSISINANSPQLVELAGATSQIPEKTIHTLRSLLTKDLLPNDIVRFSVNHLQIAARSSASLNAIGEQCNVAILLAPVDTVVTSTYHTAKLSTRSYGANVVVALTGGRSRFGGPQLFGPSTLAGPEIHKKSPCWCGSGKLFKHCHMKKFGAVETKLPMFNRPLPWTVSVSQEEPCPAGRKFCVSSAYQ